jgi:hypothetical protein
VNTQEVLTRLRLTLPVDVQDSDVVTVKARDVEHLVKDFPCLDCIVTKLHTAWEQVEQLIGERQHRG